MRRLSKKRQRQQKARREAVAAVLERDQVCQFPRLLSCSVESGIHRRWRIPIACFGDLTVHEPAGRRNCDFTDPEQGIALCSLHNEYVEIEPEEARLLGLRPENRSAIPLRKGRHVRVLPADEVPAQFFDQDSA